MYLQVKLKNSSFQQFNKIKGVKPVTNFQL